MQLLAEKNICADGGGDWIDKSPTVQKCAEECAKKVGFINLIVYGRPDNGEGICSQDGCDCQCVTGSCARIDVLDYDLYEVTEGKFESFIRFLSTLFIQSKMQSKFVKYHVPDETLPAIPCHKTILLLMDPGFCECCLS